MKCLRAHAAALFLVTTPALSIPQAGRTLSPGEMEQDLFALSESLLSLQAGRLRYASEEELDEVFGEALFEASEERSRLEFFRTVSKVVAAVRCGHTRVQIGSRAERESLDAGGLMPFDVLLEGDRAWVLHSYDPALADGGEIVSINGRSVAEIRGTAFEGMSADGFIETGKQRRLERGFARLYVLLVQGADERGRGYEVQLAGAAAPVKLAGLGWEEFTGGQVARPERPLMSVSIMPEQDLGVLMVSRFGDDDSDQPFPEQLEACFVKLKESGVGHLTVDLRGNGGGNDNYGALLVSYMASREFGYFDRIEVTADYDGPGGIVEEDGRRLVTQHRSLDPWEPAEHRFQGEVYLLEDGWTFSTAADVATVAHHNGFATLVGEESGGGYDGNTSGSSERMTLPASGMTVNVPMWMYTTANPGHEYHGRGAIPHHPSPSTIEGALAGRDEQLEAVLELIDEG